MKTIEELAREAGARELIDMSRPATKRDLAFNAKQLARFATLVQAEALEPFARAHPDEPLLHTDMADILPEEHPLAHENVHCDACGEMLHAFNNECMQAWVEKYRSDLYVNVGNFCLPCYVKAGGHPWPKGMLDAEPEDAKL
jgi:hypothetical protein